MAATGVDEWRRLGHIMTMDTPKMPPSPDDELRNLEPLIGLLYEGFERATEEACQFFEMRTKPIDPALYAPLVRYHMVQFLRDKGQVVDDFEQEKLFNNGLCVTFAGRCIRMWKAGDDTLPSPGSSIAKQSFLSQQLTYLPETGGVLRPLVINLVILWNIDAHHRLKRLHLVCPKSASQDGLFVEAYWSCPIPHPATYVDTSQVARSEIESEDLPIGIRVPEAASNEEAR